MSPKPVAWLSRLARKVFKKRNNRTSSSSKQEGIVAPEGELGVFSTGRQRFESRKLSPVFHEAVAESCGETNKLDQSSEDVVQESNNTTNEASRENETSPASPEGNTADDPIARVRTDRPFWNFVYGHGDYEPAYLAAVAIVAYLDREEQGTGRHGGNETNVAPEAQGEHEASQVEDTMVTRVLTRPSSAASPSTAAHVPKQSRYQEPRDAGKYTGVVKLQHNLPPAMIAQAPMVDMGPLVQEALQREGRRAGRLEEPHVAASSRRQTTARPPPAIVAQVPWAVGTDGNGRVVRLPSPRAGHLKAHEALKGLDSTQRAREENLASGIVEAPTTPPAQTEGLGGPTTPRRPSPRTPEDQLGHSWDYWMRQPSPPARFPAPATPEGQESYIPWRRCEARPRLVAKDAPWAKKRRDMFYTLAVLKPIPFDINANQAGCSTPKLDPRDEDDGLPEKKRYDSVQYSPSRAKQWDFRHRVPGVDPELDELRRDDNPLTARNSESPPRSAAGIDNDQSELEKLVNAEDFALFKEQGARQQRPVSPETYDQLARQVQEVRPLHEPSSYQVWKLEQKGRVPRGTAWKMASAQADARTKGYREDPSNVPRDAAAHGSGADEHGQPSLLSDLVADSEPDFLKA